MSISRRSESLADEPFLHRLLLERTAQKLGLDHLPAPMREQILTMQVRLRLGSVRANYSDGSSEIILLNGQPVGWVFICETRGELRLVEIVVLSECRGQGIGAATIGEIIARAERASKPVRLRVDAMNTSAFRLYERLGFRRTGGDEVQHEMERPVQVS
jgi:ribosomal protein S18 acetylase RimI-like enzyme